MGFGTESVVKIKTDVNGCMIVDELEREIAKGWPNFQLLSSSVFCTSSTNS